MTDYTLTPLSLTVYDEHEKEKEVVFRVSWSYEARSDEYASTMCGETAINFETEPPFTAYEKLEPDQVVKWVLSTWGDAGLKQNQSVLDSDIERQKGPKTQSPPLPWAKVSP